MMNRDILMQILNLARWAPSGDNTQPWRFELIAPDHVLIHGHDTRDWVVYDWNGHASHIAHGTLLETIRIAASAYSLRVAISRRPDTPEKALRWDVKFITDSSVVASPLVPCITSRCTQRRMMHTRPLTLREKSELESAVGGLYKIVWLENFAARWHTASLMFANAKLRLTMPEAYEVHRAVIEWDCRYSEDKMPAQAIGADPITTRLMRFVMNSWERVEFFNKYLAGTLAPRVQLDLLPGLACAAHLALIAQSAPRTVDDWVEAGAAVQRLWLTATQLGLAMQPEMTPLIFSAYVRQDQCFTSRESVWKGAQRLACRFDALLGAEEARCAVWACRTGAGPLARSRSTRLPLHRLWIR
jgi:sulfur-carrier protein adenylyltransferase/sulfurtransferase